MAFQSSTKTRVLAGALNLSCEARDVSVSFDVDALDTSTICDTSRTYIPGRSTASLSASGPLDVDTTAGGPYDLLTDWVGTTQPIVYAPRGLATGTEAMLLTGLNTNFTTTSPHDSTADYSLTAEATDFDFGFMVDDLTAITVDGNGTARDFTAQTTNGGVAHMHVTAFSGLTNNIVTIEHSVDGATSWATLVTFATYTGITSERVVVAAGTTVRRYLRVVDNVTGVGSTTRAVAFARR